MPHIVDLRSDTITRPTEGMRRAMAGAEVGDDVYGEDPSVRALEDEVADLFGHEAAVFVPSGTMGNQICLRLVVPPAGELLCDAEAHIVTYESGGAAQHGGIQTRTFTSPDGVPAVAEVAGAIRPPGFAMVPTSAVAVEQTHNRHGGAVVPLDVLTDLRLLTAQQGVALHCDGARIWNASVAAGVNLRDYGVLFDTLSVCLSKGLGAPVGSLLVTDASRAAEGRLLRRRLGGGMRQAGVLAAAGLYALRHHLARLAEDHRRAHRLAVRLAGAGAIDTAAVHTNIVSVALPNGRSALALASAAREAGVLISVVDPRRFRLVTHLDVDDEGVERAGEVLVGLLTS